MSFDMYVVRLWGYDLSVRMLTIDSSWLLCTIQYECVIEASSLYFSPTGRVLGQKRRLL